MSAESDLVYRTRAQILSDLLIAFLARWPDVQTTPDSVVRIWAEVEAQSLEGIYLANQLLHDDMFVDTAQAVSLLRYGEQYGRPRKVGTLASGDAIFSGDGGTVIATAAQVSAEPISGDPLLFNVTSGGTIPNPGTPTAPTTADGGGSGAIAAGTYEHAISFVTAGGETDIGAISTPVTIVASHKVSLTAIPLGGAGTTARKVYRRISGGAFGLITTIADNTTTTYLDNTASPGAVPLDISTAERITLPIEADETGVEYNVAAGTVVVVADAPGVASVTNPSPLTGGSDDEDIETMRQELLEFIRAPKTGSPADLEAWAESIDGIESATAFSNDNVGTPAAGHATVRIVGPDGSVPDAGKIAEVLAYLQSKDVANVTLHVATFTANPITVTMDVTTEGTYTLADVTPDVTAAINDYIEQVPVGGTVYRAGLFWAVFDVPGVLNLTISAPAADATSTATQKPTAGTITIT